MGRRVSEPFNLGWETYLGLGAGLNYSLNRVQAGAWSCCRAGVGSWQPSLLWNLISRTFPKVPFIPWTLSMMHCISFCICFLKAGNLSPLSWNCSPEFMPGADWMDPTWQGVLPCMVLAFPSKQEASSHTVSHRASGHVCQMTELDYRARELFKC